VLQFDFTFFIFWDFIDDIKDFGRYKRVLQFDFTFLIFWNFIDDIKDFGRYKQVLQFDFINEFKRIGEDISRYCSLILLFDFYK